jgi:toxin ParE1/3/4
MDRKVIWSDTAVTDLDAAAEFISKDSPAYAATFVLRSLDAARSLGDLAERGRVVPEFKDETMREIFTQRNFYPVKLPSTYFIVELRA